MDINIEFLDGLTSADLDAITTGQKLLSEARRDVKAFLENCLFHANEFQIEFPTDNSSIKEYVLYNGKWQRRVNNRSYELPINDADVFDAYKNAYMTTSNQNLKDDVAAFRARAQAILQAVAQKANTTREENL